LRFFSEQGKSDGSNIVPKHFSDLFALIINCELCKSGLINAGFKMQLPY